PRGAMATRSNAGRRARRSRLHHISTVPRRFVSTYPPPISSVSRSLFGSRGATRVAASRKSRERARQSPSRSPTRRPAPTGICCSDEQMRAEVYVIRDRRATVKARVRSVASSAEVDAHACQEPPEPQLDLAPLALEPTYTLQQLLVHALERRDARRECVGVLLLGRQKAPDAFVRVATHRAGVGLYWLPLAGVKRRARPRQARRRGARPRTRSRRTDEGRRPPLRRRRSESGYRARGERRTRCRPGRSRRAW